MTALDRKLVRDLWRLKGQVATIALVLACGIMAMIMLRSTFGSLLAARDAYYEQYRFADVFARLERAPQSVATRLEQLPGVALVETRVVKDVMVPMADEPDPVSGRIVSLPDVDEPVLNQIYLRSGRRPMNADEAVVLEQFATAHELVPGDRIPVVINGRLRWITAVGIALSPEYVIAMSGREMQPDKRRFVVLWMLRSEIAPAFQMDGAFNDVVIRREPNVSEAALLKVVDRELARYGGLHAVSRTYQLSNYTLSGELDVLRTIALIVPTIFLAVAAFLVNVVISRLVFLERTQIAVLKALGFSNGRVARHYLALVAVIVSFASVAGVLAGMWTGQWMTNLYADFYRFPTRLHRLSLSLVGVTCAIGFAAAVVGALAAVRRVSHMPPAQAMRPPAPLSYSRTLVDRIGLGRLLGTPALMVVREIRRRPLRFIMSTFGIAMGIAIFVMGRFSTDSFDYLMSDVYPREHREHLTVSVERPVPMEALYSLQSLPGIEYVEGERIVPVRMHARGTARDATLSGLAVEPELRQVLDRGEVPVELPVKGILLNRKLADLLDVRTGDVLEVDLLEGDYSARSLPVNGIVDDAFGLNAYARADWLASVLREQPRISRIHLRVDSLRISDVRARLKEMPEVLGVTSTEDTIATFRAQMGESMVMMVFILTLSAAAISIGIVYNNARIALSLRGRDLATLRVLGFTRIEISTILLGELGAQVVLGIPLGLWLGTVWARAVSASIDSETIRLWVHISPRTYAAAAVIALTSAVVSALLVRRKLDDLDLVAVLKSSE